MVPESGGFWPQAGNLRFPALTKDAFASFESCSSVALLPMVSSRGAAARAGRGTAGPSRSSVHGADCPREPQAPSLLASPGERRSPELAAQGAANVRGRRERLALSVRQDSVSYPAETDRLAGAYLNTPPAGRVSVYQSSSAAAPWASGTSSRASVRWVPVGGRFTSAAGDSSRSVPPSIASISPSASRGWSDPSGA